MLVSAAARPVEGLIDPANLLGRVTWQTRAAVRKLAAEFHRQTGMYLQMRSGRRTCAEQNELFAIGRTILLDKPKITYAPGCMSWHVTGRAVDVNIVRNPDGSGRTDLCQTYGLMGGIWEQQTGGRWGGRFSGFGPCGDAGHVELPGHITDFCKNPNDCAAIDAAVDALVPDPQSPWPYALGAFLLVGAAGLAIAARK